MVFLKTPRLTHLRNTFVTLESDFTGDLRILYASILVFYFGTGLISVAFVPLLRAKGMPDALIFAASTINLAVLAPSFRYFGSRMKRENFVRDSVLSLVLRSLAFGSIGVAAYFLTGILFYVFAVLFYTLASGVAAGVYYTTSTAMIYESLGVEDKGSAFGIYVALTGVCTTLSALASGYVTFYSAYYVTFLLTGACFALCAWITMRLRFTPFASG